MNVHTTQQATAKNGKKKSKRKHRTARIAESVHAPHQDRPQRRSMVHSARKQIVQQPPGHRTHGHATKHRNRRLQMLRTLQKPKRISNTPRIESLPGPKRIRRLHGNKKHSSQKHLVRTGMLQRHDSTRNSTHRMQPRPETF